MVVVVLVVVWGVLSCESEHKFFNDIFFYYPGFSVKTI